MKKSEDFDIKVIITLEGIRDIQPPRAKLFMAKAVQAERLLMPIHATNLLEQAIEAINEKGQK